MLTVCQCCFESFITSEVKSGWLLMQGVRVKRPGEDEKKPMQAPIFFCANCIDNRQCDVARNIRDIYNNGPAYSGMKPPTVGRE